VDTVDSKNKPPSFYHVHLTLTRGYVAKLLYLRRDTAVDIRQRLDLVLDECKYHKTGGSVVSMSKKYEAELTIPTTGFTDPAFRPGTLLEALRTHFGEVTKNIKLVRE